MNMDTFINNLKEVVSPEMIIYAGIALLALIVISMMIRHLRIRKIREELDKFENKYAEFKGIPLSFKLNKATALSKVNKMIAEHIGEYQQKFDETQEYLKEFSVLLAELDDFVYSKKIKKSNQKIEELIHQKEELSKKLEDTKQLASELVNFLEVDFDIDKIFAFKSLLP